MMSFAVAFPLVLRLITLWSWFALVSTGQLHQSVCIAGFLLLGAPLFGAARLIRLPQLVWTLLVVGAFILAGIGVFYVQEIMYSIVYFFLFLQVWNVWSARQNRDHLQGLILSFFQMVGASVMTASIGFGGMFIVYAFLMTTCWLLITFKRDADSLADGSIPSPNYGWLGVLRRIGLDPVPAGRPPAAPQPVREGLGAAAKALDSWRVITPMFLGAVASLSFTLVIGSIALFFVFPRLSQNSLLSGIRLSAAQKESGFSDQVDLQSFGEIQLDPTVIGRVSIVAAAGPEANAAARRPGFLRMRGTSLDFYTGNRWVKGRLAYSYKVPIVTSRLNFVEASEGGDVIRQDVMLDPDGSAYFFGATQPGAYGFDKQYPLQLDQMSFSLEATTGREHPLRYQVESRSSAPPTDAHYQDAMARLARGDYRVRFQGSDSRATETLLSGGLVGLAVDATQRIARANNIRPPGQPPVRTREFTRGNEVSFLPPVGLLADRPRDEEEARTRAMPGLVSGAAFGSGARGFVTPSFFALRQGRVELPPQLKEAYLQIPIQRDLESVRTLATELETLAGGKDASPIRRAEAIVEFFRGFQYTTDLKVENPAMHLTEFLTVAKRGHCEYFATGMVLLLRAQQVPARIVNGYYTDDWNETGRYFMVRRQHAHSWVELWAGPLGWVTYDPTPPVGVGAARISRSVLSPLQHWLDAGKYYWYRHVIDYDINDQYGTGRTVRFLRRGASEMLDKLLQPLRLGLESMGEGSGGGMTAGKVVLVGLLIIVILGVGVLLCFELAGILKRRRGGATGGGAGGADARALALRERTRLYRDILEELARRDLARKPSQTPAEFAALVADRQPEWGEFVEVTREYYEVRYRDLEGGGGVASGAGRGGVSLPRAGAFLERLRATESAQR